MHTKEKYGMSLIRRLISPMRARTYTARIVCAGIVYDVPIHARNNRRAQMEAEEIARGGLLLEVE